MPKIGSKTMEQRVWDDLQSFDLDLIVYLQDHINKRLLEYEEDPKEILEFQKWAEKKYSSFCVPELD